MTASGHVTQLLIDWSNGDKCALNELVPIVMEELRRRAHNQLLHERPGHTFQTTELVNEAYLRLAGYEHPSCRERTHFFAMAAKIMRQVLVDCARRKVRAKRDGVRVQIDVAVICSEEPSTRDRVVSIIELDEALSALEVIDPVKASVAEMKLFAGLSHQEIADKLGISVSKATKSWTFAKAYLAREINRRHDS